jgi:hypothetical protein
VGNIKPMVVKLILVTGVLSLILGLLYGVSFVGVLLMSAILAVVSYYVGDLIILPLTNNITAVISDFILSFAVIWLVCLFLIRQGAVTMTGVLIAALAIAAGEYFFHLYMGNQQRIEEIKSKLQ